MFFLILPSSNEAFGSKGPPLKTDEYNAVFSNGFQNPIKFLKEPNPRFLAVPVFSNFELEEDPDKKLAIG